MVPSRDYVFGVMEDVSNMCFMLILNCQGTFVWLKYHHYEPTTTALFPPTFYFDSYIHRYIFFIPFLQCN